MCAVFLCIFAVFFIVFRSMKRVCVLDKVLESNAQFYLYYLKCLQCIVGIHKSSLRNDSLKLAVKLLRTAYLMENSFLGIDFNVNLNLYALKLFAHLVFLLSSSQEIDTKSVSLFLSRLKQVKM